jgi:hypothetical protein
MKSLAFILLFISSLAQADSPDFAIVKAVQIDGSGCEAGSANAVMTSDLNFLSVLYDRFSAEIGKGTANPGAHSSEKHCTINVTIQIPPGWNFQFDSVDYNGFVNVPKLAIAYQLITAEVYGGRGMAFDQNIMKGPKTENFSTRLTNASGGSDSPSAGGKLGGLGGLLGGLGKIKNKVDQLKSGSPLLNGCSNQIQETKIKIKSTIGVRNPFADVSKKAVQIVVDSTDAAFKQNLKLTWIRCH